MSLIDRQINWFLIHFLDKYKYIKLTKLDIYDRIHSYIKGEQSGNNYEDSKTECLKKGMIICDNLQVVIK